MFTQGWLQSATDERVRYSVRTDRPAVALTIDDGPDPATTPEILDTLTRAGARATFFLITDRIPNNEQLIQRMLDEGHELGNHMTADRPSILLSRRRFAQDLSDAHDALAAYAEPRWLRPGSGLYNRGMLDTAEQAGYQLALASLYPLDANIPSSWLASEVILRRARPGDVILLHDHSFRGERTVRTLRRVLPELSTRGFEVVTLSELVDIEE